MNESRVPIAPFSLGNTLHPKATRWLRMTEAVFVVAGLVAIVLQYGLLNVTAILHWELGLVVIAGMALSTASLWVRYRWSRERISFVSSHRGAIAAAGLWLCGIAVILLFGPLLPEWYGLRPTRATAFLVLSELCLAIRAIASLGTVMRSAIMGGTNPALVLVGSFGLLVAIGTLLLMLPKARAMDAAAAESFGPPPMVALFTATSASCVTGLTVVPTDTYWSRTGQTIILCLFQLGGLGIMTFGAFFALAGGRSMPMRHSATLSEMMESDGVGQLRRMVLAIVGFTFTAELTGAVLISGLWSGKSFGEQVYFSMFHSVSAFCNAGFSITPDSFAGMGERWQVWGVMAGLIILGGLGFAVLYNLSLLARSRLTDADIEPLFNLPRKKVRVLLTTKLVLVTSAVLLLSGAVVFYLLESAGETERPTAATVADAWFQSVTFRTAGFHTVDHAELRPSTKLFAIALMFIGASPGSTGGGVKTICFALGFLAVASSLRGRPRVEVAGRTIPDIIVSRALAIVAMGTLVLMAATMLVVIFEQRPERFLDHLYETTSALGTVGVSTGITAELTTPSKLVIVMTMFLGRVGPLTLLMALAGRASEARYDYPLERVTLG